MGPILQQRGERMHVLSGNHESLADVERLCAKHELDSFHERSMQLDG
ncbi:MAG: hypothetical protein ABSF98_29525 [Bryobacteraceae bacterium]